MSARKVEILTATSVKNVFNGLWIFEAARSIRYMLALLRTSSFCCQDCKDADELSTSRQTGWFDKHISINYKVILRFSKQA